MFKRFRQNFHSTRVFLNNSNKLQKQVISIKRIEITTRGRVLDSRVATAGCRFELRFREGTTM